jgi:hypothetical protein
MNLDIDVRFTNDTYKQLGRGHVSITTDNDELPLTTVRQLGLAAAPMITALIGHAQLEAVTSLKQQEREQKEKAAETGGVDHEDK